MIEEKLDNGKTALLFCGECDNGPIHAISAGDEGWDYCDMCNQIEGKTYYVDADDWFDHEKVTRVEV